MKMSKNSSRRVRIATMLIAEKKVAIPKAVFDDVMSAFSSKEGVHITSQRRNRGCFEVNGLMREIRSIKNRLCTKYRGEFHIDLDNSAKERKRCMVSIRSILPSIPDKAKAQFKNGSPKFVDGPYKGEEVVWSSRIENNDIPIENELSQDIFIVEPDRYRSTFYGWKRKY